MSERMTFRELAIVALVTTVLMVAAAVAATAIDSPAQPAVCQCAVPA